MQNGDHHRGGPIYCSRTSPAFSHLARRDVMRKACLDGGQHRFEQIVDESWSRGGMAQALRQATTYHAVEVSVDHTSRKVADGVLDGFRKRSAWTSHDGQRLRPFARVRPP
ncbi:hypothetical protein GKE62_04930 [Novosphingobium sp. Gsoil 351]|nr:hypothetical protein GKE62_04930 [Novosphingobium sp. Gsoil 351]